jgi:tetratricopeptide (TPR) repeat protein
MSVATERILTSPQQRSVAHEIETAERHLKEGRPGEAEAIYEELLRRAPRQPRLWNGLGLVAYMKGKMEEAKRHLEHAVALDPNQAAFHNHLAVVCRALGETEAAVGHYRKALELNPNEPVFFGNLGHALRRLKQTDEAIDCYRRAVALAPGETSLAVNLGLALGEAKRYAESLAVLREAVAVSPELAGAHLALGNALAGLERYEEAIAAYRQAAALDPTNPGSHHNMGTALQNLGRMEEAAEAYRCALAVRPDFTASLRQLASMRSHAPGAEEAAELEKLLWDDALPEESRVELYMALASTYDTRGDFDKAWERLQAGNQIIHRKLGYDPEGNTRFVDRIIDTFSKGFFAERRSWGNPSELPVFIVGMPRSGTTLVEQIICSHPQVYGAGELRRMHELSSALPAQLKRRLPYPEVARHLDRSTTGELAQEYLDHLLSLSPDAVRITDKMPFNYRLIGLISLCFPNARVINCRRDPLDICLSCYFAKFREALDFAYNLVDLGRYYRDYERLMAHWRDTVRLRWLDMSYEELVAHQEEKSRELVAFCGLEWDARCLNYHETERAVLTASNWQVRQPIYRSSVARWQHYEKFLGPLIETLDYRRPEAADNTAVASRPAASGERRGREG